VPAQALVRGVRFGACFAASTALVGAAALGAALASGLTGFRDRAPAGRVASGCARALLRVWGVRLEVVGGPWPLPGRQLVWISNHTNSLDPFVVCALGLPRVRYLLSRWLRVVLPLWALGEAIGIFWTPPQSPRSGRVALFRRVTRALRRSGESVFLTPEGVRVRTGRIGPFNRGAFHLAIALEAPIVPLFVETPPGTDPGLGLDVGAGVVRVHVGAPIDTSGWRLEEVARRRDEVQALYEGWQARLAATSSSAGRPASAASRPTGPGGG
jgi:1-acyl-sn-glycerol-3-phosphate acyltransferase